MVSMVLDLSRTGILAALSHELRTPLNGMIGFSELLHRGDAGPLSADQKELVSDILTSARHLLEMIDGAADLVRLEEGTLELHPEPVDLALRLPAFCEEVRGLAAQHGLAITVAVDPSLGTLLLDPASLQRVVYRCVAEAARRTTTGGTIAVRAIAQDEGHFRLEISANVIEDPASSSAPLSLGQTVVTRLIKIQGGTADFRREPDGAGTFFAVLPRRPSMGEATT